MNGKEVTVGVNAYIPSTDEPVTGETASDGRLEVTQHEQNKMPTLRRPTRLLRPARPVALVPLH